MSTKRTIKKNHNHFKHGKCYSSEYRAWRDMKQRCNNKNAPNFRYYGGRGIKICERWLNFENFYADIGDRPGKDYQLDRIDPDGHYEPGNCRWITREENFINRRCSPKSKNQYITVKKCDLCKKCLAKVLKQKRRESAEEKSGQLTLLELQNKEIINT